MDRSNVITLIGESFTENEYGVQIPVETRRTVFCKVTSVSLSEWTEGGRLGLNPEFRMTMFGPDYLGEKVLEFNNARYSIYRTYYGRNDTLDLYVERRSGS